jgi:heme O synthase-like polyprenyltransferase
MHTGALMAARQALGQYLVYAKPWQRRLIAAGVIAGGALLIAAGIATGHVVMAVVGGLVLLAAGNACVQVLRARRGVAAERTRARSE